MHNMESVLGYVPGLSPTQAERGLMDSQFRIAGEVSGNLYSWQKVKEKQAPSL